MPDSRLERIIEDVELRKAKLYNKVMSLDGYIESMIRSVDLYEYTLKITSLLNISTLLPLFNVEWTFNIPGIPLPPPSIPIPPPPPPITPPPPQIPVLLKAKYGITMYDLSYYDPAAWRVLFGRLIIHLLFRSPRHVSQKWIYPAVASATNTYESLTFSLSMRVYTILQLVSYFTVAGFTIAGMGSPSERAFDVKVKTKDPELHDAQVVTSNVFEVSCGMICGYSPADYFRVVAKGKPLVKAEDMRQFYKHVEEQVLRLTINQGVRKNFSPKTLYETTRVHEYARKQMFVELISRYVMKALSNMKLDPITLNGYMRFAVELVMGWTRKHNPYKNVMVQFDFDTWYKYVKTKWVKMGFDEKVLDKIAEILRPIADYVRRQFLMKQW